ncbi:hypothetical protein T01_9966 [Trichinella spiralis]|uniref:Uncharacterized protein n=1 Tax=Trichinella spiralis TaxID=6334 RepID=A0A0V1B9G1_TRISP|nr:hypothetical protein T01_9966 [Trichinella spiralis]
MLYDTLAIIYLRLIVHSRQMTSSRRLRDRKVKPVGNDRAETNRRLLTRPLCQKVYYTQAHFCT